MTLYPGVNATLTLVRAPGAPDEYGDPAEGVVVWMGSAPGYLKRKRGTRPSSAGTRVDDAVDVFWLLGADGGTIAEATGVTEGHQVTIVDRRQATPVERTFRLTAVENRAAGTIADSQRWELDPVVVA